MSCCFEAESGNREQGTGREALPQLFADSRRSIFGSSPDRRGALVLPVPRSRFPLRSSP